jgi:hypothetical protein
MPKITYKIITPRGEFGSARKAAVAHDCDPGTIVKRCETDPLNYKRIAKQPGAVRAPAKKTVWVTKKITWPLTWGEYRYNTHDIKEEIYQIWCNENSRDPDLESTAEAFFDAMDSTEQAEADETTD